MNDTAATLAPVPATIHARVHDGAIRRVTRMYAAGLADIFTEALSEQPPGRRHTRTRHRRRPRDRPPDRHRRRRWRRHRRRVRPAVLRRERLERGPGPPRGRRRHGDAEPRAARLHRLVPDPDHGPRARPGLARRADARSIFSASPRPRCSPTMPRPGRTAPPSASGRRRPRPPRPSAGPPRPPRATIRCRSSSRTCRTPRPAARSSNAAPSSTARCMPSVGGGWSSACSRTAGTASA